MADMDMILKFLMAQQKEEEKGEHTFTCPLCGNEAHWSRVTGNGHLHCGCKGCGVRIAE